VFTEVRSALYGTSNDLKIISYIYGLGGRDVTTYDIETVFRSLKEIADTGRVKQVYNYVGVRE
jgi:pyruvate ferredoxin oxidoreductase alpha subunit